MYMTNLTFLCWILFFSPLLMGGNEIVVNVGNGEAFILDVDPSESVAELQEKILALAGAERAWVEITDDKNFDILCQHVSRSQGGFLGAPRRFDSSIEHKDREDIRYIVTSLANKSILGIASIQGELEAAGNRIDHLHPLCFLMVVFSDEELKVGIRNIRGRTLFWNPFISGLKTSLTTEARLDNMRPEFIHNFSSVVNINPAIIIPSLQNQQWDEFIDLLIIHVKREGNHDRYNA